jgi:hypothetical protein
MLNMRQKKAITKELKIRYNKAAKKEKTEKYLMNLPPLPDTTAAMHPGY